MSALLFYEEITLLNRERHKGLRLKPAADFQFAARAHLVPLAGQEFFQAARDYPILFLGEGEAAGPIALMGLESERNHFVDADGRWAPNRYVPAFVRRYPFVLADTGEDEFSVCFDAAYEGWNEEAGEALFDDQGKNAPFLDDVVRFLDGFTVEMRRTQAFVEALQRHGLLQPKTLQLAHPSGARFVVNDFLAVDETAFGNLADDAILELRQQGFLGWIYAHLISLGAANGLFERYLAEQAEASDAGKAEADDGVAERA